MSTSLSFVARRDTEGEFRKMMDIKLYCEKVNVSYPKEVSEYFGDLAGESESCIKDEMMMMKLPLKVINEDYKYGYEIDVKNIPKGVKTIMAYMS